MGQKEAKRGKKRQKGAKSGKKRQKGAKSGKKGQKGAKRGKKGQKETKRGTALLRRSGADRAYIQAVSLMDKLEQYFLCFRE